MILFCTDDFEVGLTLAQDDCSSSVIEVRLEKPGDQSRGNSMSEISILMCRKPRT